MTDSNHTTILIDPSDTGTVTERSNKPGEKLIEIDIDEDFRDRVKELPPEPLVD